MNELINLARELQASGDQRGFKLEEYLNERTAMNLPLKHGCLKVTPYDFGGGKKQLQVVLHLSSGEELPMHIFDILEDDKIRCVSTLLALNGRYELDHEVQAYLNAVRETPAQTITREMVNSLSEAGLNPNPGAIHMFLEKDTELVDKLKSLGTQKLANEKIIEYFNFINSLI